MNEEGSLFDVPPAAIGRYRVRQPLGAGTTGPAFYGETPDTGASVAIKLFKVDLSPDAAHELAQALNVLIDQTPEHDALAIPLDAGLDEIEAYFVTGLVDGTSLDAALRDFGPAAIEDLVPRLRSLAGALDAAHRVGLVHGALHPRDILVSSDTTYLTGVGVGPVLARAGVPAPVRRPYGAPETATGAMATAESDQFSLAAIAFEWLFGRRISGPAERPIEVRALPGVDREALATAFTTALAPEPDARFESCSAFCEAVASAVDGNSAVERVAAVEDAMPLRPTHPAIVGLPDEPEVGPLHSEYEAPMAATEPERVESRFQSMAPMAPARPVERFGAGALVATLLVGLGVGFAAGYMAKPRALQNPPLAGSTPAGERSESTGQGDTAAAVAVPAEAAPAAAPEPARATPAVPAPPVRAARPVVGTLVVESRPSGAAITINGQSRGTTPLTLDEMVPGEYEVRLALRGYRPFVTTVRVVPGERARAAASLSAQERE